MSKKRKNSKYTVFKDPTIMRDSFFSEPIILDTRPKKFYLAYGMNTNLEEMKKRCPHAVNLGTVTLHGYKLAFRKHCDVIKDDYSSVDCVLWRISEDCEYHLDQLEGYPTYYDKKEVDILFQERPIKAMVYFMTDSIFSHKLSYPSQHYLDCVTDGYLDNNMRLSQIKEALLDTRDKLESF